MAVTKLANVIDPQVIGTMVEKKLVDAIKFAPLAVLDYTLEGRPGSTVTLPSYAYIGDAEEVAEGEEIPIAQLSESSTEVKIAKIGKGVEITDETVLSGHGNPLDRGASQIVTSISSKVDNMFLAALAGIAENMTHTITGAFSADGVADALVKFGEDIEGDKVLLVSPEEYNVLRKNKDQWAGTGDIAGDILLKGTVGMVQGCQVVVSNKLRGKKAAYIVKPGALALYLKRDTLVEADRDIIHKTTVITADKHFAPYLYDASKAIKVTFGE